MVQSFLDYLRLQLNDIQTQGLYKDERLIESRQGGTILANKHKVINLCANNYLGLAGKQELVDNAIQALQEHGYGMASVRFICGTQTIHKKLENRISAFLKTDDTILYSSCFDANTGLFETLLGPEDAIISDELNHASIIDGIRLCKAQRFRYRNNDMADLQAKLKEASHCRFKLIATDGVFSMDGIIANLSDIVELSQKYDAMVMVDDSHAVGFMGEGGRGSVEYCGVESDVAIVTGTLGKALGGASGGYTSGRKEIIEWLRQRSRPYLFSNTLAPVIAATSIKIIDELENSSSLRKTLWENTRFFRSALKEIGFDIIDGVHPIIPVMIYDANVAKKMSELLMQKGIYVVGFSYPVVPKDKARIRVQMSSAHTKEELTQAIQAFQSVGRELNIIS